MDDQSPGLEPIAIVGMACRLPGEISSSSAFWDFLTRARNAQSDIPENRFKVDTWYHPDGRRPGSVNARGGYFLSHDDKHLSFDPKFFGISQLEAKTMDPQQRKLCETVYECFESAGVRLADLSGSQTGCFVGNFTWDAAYDQWKDLEYCQPYQTTGIGVTILSNRINYVFNLKGPSFTIDTACSSVIYALHYACQSLRAGDCSAAVVGGTNLVLGLEQHIGSVALGALSPTSTCHTFDSSADGYGRADAVGALYIKKLSDAIRCGDPIRAIIRGSAINTNGKGAGISHPSVHQQEAVIRAAYAQAGLDFSLTRYAECHGTGTSVGDPIEVDAIGRVFARYRSPTDPLLIGSVKTNIGHGEAASGIASIMKTALILETGEVPATIGIQELNPMLDLRDGAIHICQSNTPLGPSNAYRRASVNSFGYGGANAHAILDHTQSFLNDTLQAATLRASRLLTPGYVFIDASLQTSVKHYLLPFSAHNEMTLRHNINAIGASRSVSELPSLAFTLSNRRDLFRSRAFCITDEVDILSGLDFDLTQSATNQGRPPTIAFVFTGQGAQWAQMGLQLIDQFPTTRFTFTKLDQALAKTSSPPNWTILKILQEPGVSSRINDAEKSQTVCTAIQIALVDLLSTWRVEAVAVVGHSSGEIAAAYAAKKCSAEDAIRVAYLRGVAASAEQQAGAMMAAGISIEDAKQYVFDRKDIVVACHNSPRSVTLSGTTKAIDDMLQLFQERGLFARKLKTAGNAYHSWLMSAAGERYQQLLEQNFPVGSLVMKSLPRSGPTMVSSVTATPIAGDVPLSYWTRNLLGRVEFARAVNCLLDQFPQVNRLIEIGPHTALAGPLRDIFASHPTAARKTTYLSTLSRGSDSAIDMLELAGKLFLEQYPLDLAIVNGFQKMSTESGDQPDPAKVCQVLTNLPPYQWTYEDQDQIMPVHSRLSRDVKFRKFPRHDLLGSRVPGTSPDTPTWRNMVALENVAWLEDHLIAGDFVFPAAGYVAIVIEAATQAFADIDAQTISVESLTISSALLLQKSTAVEVITDCVVDRQAGHLSFTVKSTSSRGWAEHARGDLRVNSPIKYADRVQIKNFGGSWGINSDSYCRMWFESMRKVGMMYGPAFTILSDITVRAKTLEASATVSLHATSDTMPNQSAYALHPTAIDAAFQLIVMAVHEGKPDAFNKPYIPTLISNLSTASVSQDLRLSSARIKVTGERRGLRQIAGMAVIADTDGKILLKMEVELTSLESDFGTVEDALAVHPYNRLFWRPDFDLLTAAQLSKSIPYRQKDELVKIHFERLEECCKLILLNDYKRVPRGAKRDELPFHMQKYVGWVEAQGKHLSQTDDLPHSTDEAREERIAQLVEEFGERIPELALVARLHNHMLEIVLGKLNALEVMVQDELLSQVYERGFSGMGAYDKLASVMQLLGHKDPSVRILEVGAGSGGATLPVLKALRGDTAFPQFREYVFTDVSTAFLSRAKSKFEECNRITYSLLDIEQDIGEQGFEEHSFDIIIASNVIHATESIVGTLKCCRRLLKPGGKLILIETTQIRLVTGLLVGQLPGYWLGVEDGRPDGPFISEDEWNNRLAAAGFTGSDHVLHDYQMPYNSTSVIVSRNPDESPFARTDSPMEDVNRESVYLIYLDEPHRIIASIETHYKSRKTDVHRVSLRDVGGLSSLNRVVILIELEAPVLFDMSETVLQGLQQLVQLSKFAVWVTNSGTIYGKIPEKSLVMGFVRSATIEEPSFRVCTIDLDPETLDMSLERAATLVCNAEIGFSSSPDTTSDYNFVEKDGILHISRNIIDEDENRAFRLLNAQETKLESCPSQSSAQMHRIGDPRTIYWDSKASLPILNKYEVMIDLSKASLDVYVLGMLNGLKGYPPNTIECQGTVRAVGSAVTRCEPGDQIICFGPEWFETTFVVHQTDCLVVRKETASDDAAGNSAVTPEPSRLMDNADTRSHAEGPYASSDDIARWRGSMSITGENGLLNWAQRWLFARKNHSLQNNDPPVSAQSGVSRGLHDLFGQYKYFCLAQHILNEIHAPPNGGSVLVDLPGEMLGYALAQRLSTYRVSVTASYASEQEREVLSSILHVSTLDESASWSYARFDVVLTNRVSSLSEGHLDAVRRGGGVVAISTTGQSGLRLASSLLSCGLTVQCVDVLKILEKGHHKLSRHLSTVAALLRNGEIQPAPSHEFPLSDFDSAARAVNDKQRYVGVVLATGRDVLVPVRQRPPPVSFKPDASYILVGCLGGLGRVITMWMIDRGARNLIFLSRSAADKPEAAAVVRELQELAQQDIPELCFQIIRGDVSNAEDVAKAIRSATFPIKGVIHAAMVLKESLFNTMTLDVWDRVVRPKVRGAQYLHEQTLDMDLDFFVMTSTILSVVGAATQSNYAAANAYLDHLARHRHQRGLQATSISIGMVVDIGYVEEHDASAIALRRNGMYGINMQEFLHNLELSCRRKDMAKVLDWFDPCAASNIITGMDPTRITRNSSKSIWQRDARLRHFLHAMEDHHGSTISATRHAKTATNPLAELKQAAQSGEAAARQKLTQLLTEKIAGLVMVEADVIDPNSTMPTYGMDSMIGAELRAWLQRELGADVPFLVLLDQNLTFTDLSDRVFSSIGLID